MLVAGQKSGIVHALDPDKSGEVLWQTRVGRGGTMGGVQWGSAADQSNVYVALSDIGRVMLNYSNSTDADPKQGGGMFALRLEDGERVWYTPPPGCGTRQRCSPAQSAAVSAIPGVAFSGSVDGHMRAYSTTDGKIIWDFDTIQTYDTVNGVPAAADSIEVLARRLAAAWCSSIPAIPRPAARPGTFCSRFQSTASRDRGSQRSRLAAVGIDDRALTEGRLRRREEGDEARDLVRLAEARDAEARAIASSALLRSIALGGERPETRLQTIGRDASRIDRVDAHAVLHAAIGQHLGQIQQRGIHRAADGELGLPVRPPMPTMLTIGAGRRPEVRPGGAAAVASRRRTSARSHRPIGVGQREEVAALGGSGVVDQQIERPNCAIVAATTAAGASGFVRSTAWTRHGSPSGAASESS